MIVFRLRKEYKLCDKTEKDWPSSFGKRLPETLPTRGPKNRKREARSQFGFVNRENPVGEVSWLVAKHGSNGTSIRRWLNTIPKPFVSSIHRPPNWLKLNFDFSPTYSAAPYVRWLGSIIEYRDLRQKRYKVRHYESSSQYRQDRVDTCIKGI